MSEATFFNIILFPIFICLIRWAFQGFPRENAIVDKSRPEDEELATYAPGYAICFAIPIGSLLGAVSFYFVKLCLDALIGGSTGFPATILSYLEKHQVDFLYCCSVIGVILFYDRLSERKKRINNLRHKVLNLRELYTE